MLSISAYSPQICFCFGSLINSLIFFCKCMHQNMSYKSLEEPRKNSEIFGKTMRIRTYADRNARRRGYNRNALPGNARFKMFIA